MKNRILLNTLLVLAISISIFGCKSQKVEDENEIKTVITEFYTNLNDKNFTNINTISTKKMQRYVKHISSIGDDLVTYKTYEVKDIKIIGKNAEVQVDTEDIYGNKLAFIWTLTKDEESWKLDMFEGEIDQNVFTEEEINYTKKPIQ